MAPRLRYLLVSAVPLLLLGGLAVILWSGKELPTSDGRLPAIQQNWLPMDLSGATAVDQIPGWDVRRGNYRLLEVAGRKVLALQPEPVIEGKVLRTQAMHGGGGVRARMHGERTKRSYPRFSVGLHQERELHLRAYPGERKLELVSCNADLREEVILTTVALPWWAWQPEDWTWLELQIVLQPEGSSNCEGRLWKEGQARSDQPLLQHVLTSPQGTWFAALQGAPFAQQPIWIDAAETLSGVDANPY